MITEKTKMMENKLQKTLNEIRRTNEKPKSCEELPAPLQQATELVRKKYGDAASFLTTFNPDLQIKIAANTERAFMGNSPTLTVVKHSYSEELLTVWIMAQLENLNDFCGVTEKMSIAQMENLARLITVEFHYFKVSELMLFLHRFKCGKYGQFYGVIDPQKLMSALQAFASDRIMEIRSIENRRQQEELNRMRDEWRNSTTAISYEEYLKSRDL